MNVDEEEKLLEERKRNAKLIKVKAERVINKAPVRMQEGSPVQGHAGAYMGFCSGKNGWKMSEKTV